MKLRDKDQLSLDLEPFRPQPEHKVSSGLGFSKGTLAMWSTATERQRITRVTSLRGLV